MFVFKSAEEGCTAEVTLDVLSVGYRYFDDAQTPAHGTQHNLRIVLASIGDARIYNRLKRRDSKELGAVRFSASEVEQQLQRRV